MNQAKKLLALCLCSTVAATSFSTINVEAKTTAEAEIASCVLADTVTVRFPVVKSQSMQAFAVSNDGFVYEANGENTNTITITGYEGTASELIIPETIDGFTVTEIGKDAFKGNGILKNVTMASTIVHIGEQAFSGCKNLSTVNLSSNLCTIGRLSFGNCTGLTSITIPKTLNEYTNATEGPFKGCTNLKTATIEEGATAVCEHLFYGSGIETVNIPSTVTEIQEYAFYNSGIQTITIPDTVKEIHTYAFDSCKKLTEVKLPSNLTAIGRMSFGNCVGLTSITIPKTLNEYTNATEGPFKGCTNLKTATIEEGATVVCEHLFYGSGIETVNVPSTIKTVGRKAFYKCGNLKNVYFSCNAPKFNKYVFTGVTATAYYPENNSTWTNQVRQNYDGTITWKTWKPAVTPVVSITGTTVTKVTTTISKKKVTLSWKKKSDVTGYEIYKKTGDGKYKLVKTIKKAGTKKWTDKAVKRGETYYYKIRAYKKGTNKKTYSKFSSVKKVIVQ